MSDTKLWVKQQAGLELFSVISAETVNGSNTP
jgi:hypothetical protein